MRALKSADRLLVNGPPEGLRELFPSLRVRTHRSSAAGVGRERTRAHKMEIPEMVNTLDSRRLTSILVLGLFVLAGLMLASPAVAQEPGGRFRVLIPDLEVEDGVRERFARNVANETKKLIDGMVTHRSMPKGDLNNLLKQYKLRERDLTCITSQQLAAQGGVELVMCGTISSAGDAMETNAFFITQDQTRFEIAPVVSGDAKEIAQHIFTSFETFVNQLSLVHYCNEDIGASQWDGALEKCSEALELNPNSEAALYGQGYSLMQLERYDESLTSLKGLLEKNPIHPEGLQAAGFVSAQLGLLDESRSFFNQYLELNPGNVQVRLTVARDALDAGDAEGALAIAEQGLTAGEEDIQLVEYAGYFASRAASDAGRRDDGNGEAAAREAARGFYQKTVDYLGRVYEELGDEVRVDVLTQLLNATTQLGRTEDAVELGSRAVVSKPGESRLWHAYAGALRAADRTSDAIVAMDSVLALDPEARNVRAQQAQWLLQDGNLEAAGAAFRKAVDAGELESESAGMTILAIGVNEKFNKGDQQGAVPYFEQAKEFVTKPESKGMINFFHGVATLNQGIAASKEETLASAQASLPIFQKALELFNQSSAYGETSPDAARSLQEHIQHARDYIEIQELLIKRGR